MCVSDDFARPHVHSYRCKINCTEICFAPTSDERCTDIGNNECANHFHLWHGVYYSHVTVGAAVYLLSSCLLVIKSSTHTHTADRYIRFERHMKNAMNAPEKCPCAARRNKIDDVFNAHLCSQISWFPSGTRYKCCSESSTHTYTQNEWKCVATFHKFIKQWAFDVWPLE